MSERSSGGPFLLLAVSAFNIGLAIGHLTGESSSKTEDKVRDVQVYNHQISQELSQSFGDVEDLSLTMDGKKLSFVGDGRDCTGEYAVSDNTAHIAGQVACSVEIQNIQTTEG